MHRLLTSTYVDNLDAFVRDLIKYEDLIGRWMVNHPEYTAEIHSDVDGGRLYTITIICKKQLEE